MEQDLLNLLLANGSDPLNISARLTELGSNSARTSWFRTLLEQGNIYLTPAIIFLGVFGNLLSFCVFTSTYLRVKSSSIYLASLSLADAGFLVSLFFVWLSRLHVPIFKTAFMCQLFLYVHYVFCFLSVWSVVGFTCERYVVVYHPLKKDGLCTKRMSKAYIAVVTSIACIGYTFAFRTNGVQYYNGVYVCMPLPEYYDIMTIVSSLDMLITFVIPSALIVVLNIRIIHQLRHYQKQSILKLKRITDATTSNNVDPSQRQRRRPLVSSTLSRSGSMHFTFMSRTLLADEDVTSNSLMLNPISQINSIRRNISQYRTARILLLISTTFLILNSPNHIFRIQAFLHSLIAQQSKGPRHIIVWQELFQLVYFLNFSINFFVYSLCSKTFRWALRRLLSRCTKRIGLFKRVYRHSLGQPVQNQKH